MTRDEAKREILFAKREVMADSWIDKAYDVAIKSLEQPEIIRCKDCKWWSNDDYRECSNPNYDDGYVTPAGFYCGYAERKTDG